MSTKTETKTVRFSWKLVCGEAFDLTVEIDVYRSCSYDPEGF